MPFRLDDQRSTIHFLTSAEMPSLVYEAAQKVGLPSNTRYVQIAVCRALSRDLGLDFDELVASLPPTRGKGKGLRGLRAVGPANTVEDVR